MSTQASDTNQEYMPKSHVTDLPRLITQEIIGFENLAKQGTVADEVMEYLLRGLCQMTVKYVNGVVWYFSQVEQEENIKTLTKAVHEINQKFHSLKMVVNKLKRSAMQA